MTPVIETSGLTKRYRRVTALSNCTISVPEGRISALVGPNGAGKTTLLSMITGMLPPTAGRIQVAGGAPAAGAGQLSKVGFVAQDAPVYAGMSIADHFKLGAHLNPRWDMDLARERVAHLGLDQKQKAGKLSGGQRAQLALTMALAKQPSLLILDEPAAALDPLARREFMTDLAKAAAERSLSVLLSSHLIEDLERACDYLIVLANGRVQVAGRVPDLLAAHQSVSVQEMVLGYLSRARGNGETEVAR
ncbi:MAG TPA: ABC transporter ATP-binding protein [Streptosporangiaceae bacterium]|nr:ABC transporter ATP-binding protein [Streptosporangiaceae bacterium]